MVYDFVEAISLHYFSLLFEIIMFNSEIPGKGLLPMIPQINLH